MQRRRTDRAALVTVVAGAGAVLLLAGMLMWLAPAGGPQSSAGLRVGGPFRLVADDGRIVTDRSFPGKYLLIYFGYTACRDVCPTTLNSLAAAIGRLGTMAARLQPLFITVDPARDTPVVLRRYVQAFAPGLVGLTGSMAELRRVADEYGVVVPAAGDAAQSPDGAIDHSAVIYLMAPDGRFVAPIAAGASEMTMAQAIARRVD